MLLIVAHFAVLKMSWAIHDETSYLPSNLLNLILHILRTASLFIFCMSSQGLREIDVEFTYSGPSVVEPRLSRSGPWASVVIHSFMAS